MVFECGLVGVRNANVPAPRGAAPFASVHDWYWWGGARGEVGRRRVGGWVASRTC